MHSSYKVHYMLIGIIVIAFFDDLRNALNHYNLYKKDLKFLKKLYVNKYIFSIEWSRIQPVENVFTVEALQHYQKILEELINNSIEPFVTLHHFTHPAWFIRNYPWHLDSSIDKFCFYVEKAMPYLKNVKYFITFNKPYILMLDSVLDGCIPPGIKNRKFVFKTLSDILKAHSNIYKSINVGKANVRIADNMAIFKPYKRKNCLMLTN